jgi:hypothetical protein
MNEECDKAKKSAKEKGKPQQKKGNGKFGIKQMAKGIIIIIIHLRPMQRKMRRR